MVNWKIICLWQSCFYRKSKNRFRTVSPICLIQQITVRSLKMIENIKSKKRHHNIKCFYIDELGFYRCLEPDQLHNVCSNLNPANRDQCNHPHIENQSEEMHGVYYKEIRNALGISHFDRITDYEKWKNDWDKFLRVKIMGGKPTIINYELKIRVRSGIPHDYRRKVWSAIIEMRTRNMRARLSPNIYSDILNQIKSNYKPKLTSWSNDDLTCSNVDQSETNQLIEQHDKSNFRGNLAKLDDLNAKLTDNKNVRLDGLFKQIELDVFRTLPNNCHFENDKSLGIQRVRSVLRAYAYFNPTVGYCQGMNRLAAIALLILPEEMAFWCLVTIIHYIMPKDYYLKPWLAQVDCCVLLDLTHKIMPKLHDHLQANDMKLTFFTWFFTIFIDGFRPELILRIWDCFLLEGDVVLFKVALAILYISQSELLKLNDMATISSFLTKLVSTRVLDIEEIFETAFQNMAWVSKISINKIRQTHRLKMQELLTD